MEQKPVLPAVVEEEAIDLRRYLKILQKWSRVIIAGTVLSVLTAGILSWFVLPPVYEAGALLLITQPAEKERVVTQQEGVEEVVRPLTQLPEMTINTYVGQLKATALLDRVIKKLRLDPVLYTPASLAGMIKATALKDSNLIEVKVQNTDPVLAAAIGNTLCQEYLQLISEKNQEQMTRSVEFLRNQRDECDAKLSRALAELNRLENQAPNLAVLEQEFQRKSELLTSYQAELSAARVEAEQLVAATESIRRELAAISQTVTTQTYEAGKGYTGSEQVNPVYVDLAQRLNEKKTALAEKEARIAALTSLTAGLSNDLQRLQGSLSAKRNQLERVQSEVKRLQETSQKLAEKLTETQIAKSLDLGASTVVVISPAEEPKQPVKPKKKLNIAVAFVLGLMAFTGLAFVLEHLDYTVKTPDDAAQHLGLTVMGVIPLADRRTRSYGSYTEP
ncbi:MAG: Wzz/FepE/Etk N-terminal domain-containing protein [Bacillota bacterium]